MGGYVGRQLVKVFLAIVVITVAFGWADDQLSAMMSEGKYAKVIEYIDQKIPAASRTVEVWLAYAEALDRSGADKQKASAALIEAQKVNPSDPKVYAAMGDFYARQKNYQEAIKYYQKWYVLDRNAKAAEGIAVCAARLKIWDKARDAAESAVKLDSTTLESRKILSVIYFNDKDYAEAAQQLEAIVEKVKDDVNYWKKLARCYEESKNREKLMGAASHIVDLDKKDIPSRRLLSDYALEKKDQATAFNVLRELAVLTPEDAKVFKHLYQISNERGQKKDAILYLRNFLALDSSDAGSYKEMGDMQYDQKNFNEALEAYRKAVKLNPAITGVYRPYMAIVLDKKMEDEALAITPKAIKDGEIDGVTYIALGNICKKRNLCANAIGLYQNALKTDPKNLAALSSLAECQAQVGKIADALNNYQQVVLLNPNASAEYKTLGDLLMGQKKPAEAMENYRKYLEKSPEDERVESVVGLYLQSKKQYKDALACLEKVKEAKLQTVALHMAMGDCYYQTANYQKAAEVYAKARAQNPGHALLQEFLKPLADCYEKTGRQLDAAKAYEMYVKIPGVKDADASYKQAALRESTERTTAMTIYQANTLVFPQDARNFIRLGVLSSEDPAQMNKTIEMLQKASVLDPSDQLVWQKLSDAYHNAGMTVKELAASIKLTGLAPNNMEANRRAAGILYKKKQFAQAIPYLEKIAASFPQDADELTMLADANMETKSPQKAEEIYSKVKDLQPDNVKVWLDLIAAAEDAGLSEKVALYKGGLAELDKKIAAKDPKALDARVRLAQYLLNKNDWDAAYPVYKELAALTPKDKKVFARLVEIAQKKGSTADAFNYLKQYVILDPTNGKAHLDLGNLLYDQKNLDGALTEFRLAWKSDPGLTGYFQRFSEIVVAKGLDDEAVTVLNAAIKSGEADTKMFVTLGKIYQKKKQYAQAISLYKKVSNNDPKNMEVLSLLGECLAGSGDIANAILTYEQVVLLNPQASMEYKALGDLQMRQSKTDDAITAYQKYLEKATGDEKVAKTVGLYKYSKKKYQEAVTYLEMVKSGTLQDEGYLLALGDSYYQQGNCQKTCVYFGQLRTKSTPEPMLKKILRPLGECYEKNGDAAKAAEAYEAYTALPGVTDADASYLKAFLREKSDPKSAEALYLGNIKVYPSDSRSFIRLGMMFAATPATFAKATQPLSQASVLNPKDAMVLLKLAQVWGGLKNEDRELEAYKKLLALEPQNADANRRVGEILIKKKQYSKAIENLEMVQTINPQDAEVLLMLSEGYLKTGRQDKGIELLAKAQNFKKDNPELMLQLYNLYKETAKIKEAEDVIKQLIKLKKDNKYRVLYAEDLLEQARYDEALAVASDIEKSDAMNVDGLMFKGRIQGLQNKLDEAIETFKMVSFINENYPPAHYERGEIYRKQANFERAESFYRKALQANPKYALAELGLARIAKAQNKAADYQDHLKRAKALDPENKEILAEIASAPK
jgi:Predicted N-acetylglucosaminyl transferase